MSNLARYADPATAIIDSLELGKRGERVTTTFEPETYERVATLLRTGIQRGIIPQWTLRREIGVNFDQDQLNEIADQVEEGFSEGESPMPWRIDVYN